MKEAVRLLLVNRLFDERCVYHLFDIVVRTFRESSIGQILRNNFTMGRLERLLHRTWAIW